MSTIPQWSFPAFHEVYSHQSATMRSPPRDTLSRASPGSLILIRPHLTSDTHSGPFAFPAHPASIFPQRLSVRPLGTSPGGPFAQTTPPGLPSTKPMCAKSFSFQPHPIPGGSPPSVPKHSLGDARRELMAVVWLHVLCSTAALQQEQSPVKGPCPLLLAGMGGGAMAVAVWLVTSSPSARMNSHLAVCAPASPLLPPDTDPPCAAEDLPRVSGAGLQWRTQGVRWARPLQSFPVSVSFLP